MRVSRLFLALLLLCTALLPVGVVAGWLAPAWVNRHFGTWFEVWMLGSFVSAVLLMGWMLALCIGSTRLSRTQKNRWYGLLIVGGPITAAAYLWSELRRGNLNR